MDQEIATLTRQLQQLTELHDSGVLPTAQFEQGRILIQRRIAECSSGADVASMDPVGQAVAEVLAAPLPANKRSMRLVIALAVLLLVVAVAGYLWLRVPATLNPASPTVTPAVSPHATSSEQLGSMVDKLAARLKDNPADAAGWAMLARSYSVMGRTNDAVEAYVRATDLNKNDGGLLVDYADALAVKNNRNLAGEPMNLIERAMKIDPRNIKALAMSGTYSFERKDYVTAVRQWEQVIEFAGPDNLFAQKIQPSLVQARQLAGLPAGKLQASANLSLSTNAVQPASAASATVTNGSLSGTVTLAAALARDAKPEDTVFVFARAAEGSRMPLAIVRKQVKDLPFRFTLDDSMSMSPTTNLSNTGRVIVGARVSRNGRAIPEKGDFAGQSDPVAVGAKALVIEIKEVVK